MIGVGIWLTLLNMRSTGNFSDPRPVDPDPDPMGSSVFAWNDENLTWNGEELTWNA